MRATGGEEWGWRGFMARAQWGLETVGLRARRGGWRLLDKGCQACRDAGRDRTGP